MLSLCGEWRETYIFLVHWLLLYSTFMLHILLQVVEDVHLHLSLTIFNSTINTVVSLLSCHKLMQENRIIRFQRVLITPRTSLAQHPSLRSMWFSTPLSHTLSVLSPLFFPSRPFSFHPCMRSIWKMCFVGLDQGETPKAYVNVLSRVQLSLTSQTQADRNE